MIVCLMFIYLVIAISDVSSREIERTRGSKQPPPRNMAINFTPVTEREIEVVRQVQEMLLVKDVGDRDMHKWWEEYAQMMDDYQSQRNGSICTEPQMLNQSLIDIKSKVEKVRFGWNQKKEQLDKIRDILSHDDYKNITGLHNALDEYLTEQEQQATEEDERLKVEEAEVADEENILNTHACDCIWSEWKDWENCSASCGGGTKIRQRVIARNATRDGNGCDGSETDTSICNSQPCPISCMWGVWGEWSECSEHCGDGVKTRHRVRAIIAQFGGVECEGESSSEKSCNNMDHLKQTIADKDEIIAERDATIAENGATIAGLRKRLNESVDCAWRKWSEWTDCSQTCGGGMTSRNRTVHWESANGGQQCQGNPQQSELCNSHHCPIDCVWNDWTSWSSCGNGGSHTCGSGTSQRSRTAKIEAEYGGAPCVGDSTQTVTCNTAECICPSVEVNVNYSGNDLNAGGWMGRVRGNMKSAAQCRKACLNLPSCVGYSFVKVEIHHDNCAVKRVWATSNKRVHYGIDSQKIDRGCGMQWF